MPLLIINVGLLMNGKIKKFTQIPQSLADKKGAGFFSGVFFHFVQVPA